MTRLFPLLFLFFSGCLFSQLKFDTLSHRRYKTTITPAILVGYHYAGDAKDNTETFRASQMHIIELVVGRIIDYGGNHGAAKVYYAGSDFIINNRHGFFMAPKIGVSSSAGISMGAEVQFQTNFQKVIPRAMPYLGFGGSGGKLTVGYNFRLLKAENFPINTLQIGLTMPIKRFKEKS
ncbi:hypothetical protein [Chryseobacterium taiwanense]|uniref:DUF3575 domain-containing protein n=1 Tax=Chryseobacterium taiwanense TaxID=363331 RepID=A0A0B4DCL5_9FLAO|nr:hypothetical protein [Chryseobacterium taiwanense]KIC62075.1 hypothetical protein RM51_14530 [Chryseobacterium taiwanense]